MSDKRSVSNPHQQVTLLVVDDAAVIRKRLETLRRGTCHKTLGRSQKFRRGNLHDCGFEAGRDSFDLHMPDDSSFKPAFVKANLSASRVLAMSLSRDYESEQEIRSIAESFGAVRTLDKAKLLDQLIPAILQTEN
jgi:hypothetical protein